MSPCLRTNIRYRHLPSPHIQGEVSQSIISEGCIIIEPNSRVNNSILGYQIKVEQGAEVEDSILLSASHHFRRDGRMIHPVYTRIGANSHLKRVIVDKNVWIGENVEIGVEQIPRKERKRLLQSIGLILDRDFTIEEELLVLARQDVFREKPIITDNFQC